MSRNGSERAAIPDPEVVPMAERRRFTAEEKLRILEEADACTEPGEIGALVRREGIYSSYLSRWRQARDRGQLTGLGGQPPHGLAHRPRKPRDSADAASSPPPDLYTRPQGSALCSLNGQWHERSVFQRLGGKQYTGADIFSSQPIILVQYLCVGCTMSQEIEYILDGQPSSFDDRLTHHDLGIKRDPLK